MKHLSPPKDQPKGWSIGPWNSEIAIPIGYANQGISEEHYHQHMYEVYLIVQGTSVASVNEQEVTLSAGDILVVEPGEVHTFLSSSDDYFHFVIQTPFVAGDKHLPEMGDSLGFPL